MTQQSAQQSQVDRLEQRVDRMTETLATKDDVKILHDRLNVQNIIIMTGFIVTITSVILTRLLS